MVLSVNNNNNNSKPSTSIPYYLRKYKDQQPPLQSHLTHQTTIVSTRVFSYSSSSSTTSSVSNTPSPSPLTLTDSNNNQPKSKKEPMMVHLCFDEPNETNDITLTQSQNTTPLINPKINLKNLSKTVQPRNTTVITRSKTKRQMTVVQSGSFKPIQKVNSLASSEISCEEDDDEEIQQKVSTSTLKFKKKKRTSLSNKLNFDQEQELVSKIPIAQKTGRTPPHKKFRKLRLFDTPHTPKTLIKKASDISTCKKLPSPKSIKKSPMLRTNLFESKEEEKFLNVNANKVLNFDDSEDDQNEEMKNLFELKKKCPNTPGFSKTQPISFSSNSGFKQFSRLNKSPHSPFGQQLQANINPFTPTNSYDNSKLTSAANASQMVRLAAANLALSNATPGFHKSIKRCQEEDKSDSGNQENSDESLIPNKRLALRQCLVSRYHEEFHEVCKLGSGEFGDVFKCINRLDGCTYAIKRSKKPIAGSASEVNAWKEVCAHAVLVKHNHIVQYYSAWAEADRMLIQNEYCNGGSLAEFIESLKMNNLTEPLNEDPSVSTKLLMSEFDLKTLLLHIGKGLAYMHSLNLVHLDIKPGNIFICRTPRRNGQVAQKTEKMLGLVINEESGIESDEIDEDDDSVPVPGMTKSIFSEVITYKIGDLGHVTSTLDPHVEEGDCRYLPNEILQEQYENLVKADVFALALTVYVCGSLEELPKNGDEWHWIRKGNLKDLPQCSERFKKLLTQMVDEDPANRPSASTLVHHPCICPDANKTKAQLRKELNQEKFKNEILQRKVQKYEQEINKLTDSPLVTRVTQPNQPMQIDNQAETKNIVLNKNQCTSLNHNSKFTRSLSSTIL